MAAGFRVDEWAKHTLLRVVLSLLPAVLFGAWAARRGLLDEPGRHRRSLAAFDPISLASSSTREPARA